MKIQIAALAGAITVSALLLSSASAQAAPITVEAQPTARVSYADLNLRNEAGVETLNRRISRAAKHLCGVSDGLKPLNIEMNGRTCWRTAVADAQPQIDRAISTFEFAARDQRIVVAAR